MFDPEVRDRYFLRRFGLIAEEWANTRDEKHLYYLEVIRETKKQDIKQLENYDKWGIQNDDYELDHIYPKSKGFYNKIPAALIGDIRNLQIIPAIENNSKNDKIVMIPDHIKEYLDQNSISYDSLRSL